LKEKFGHKLMGVPSDTKEQSSLYCVFIFNQSHDCYRH
jgi:hypothetical protein